MYIVNGIAYAGESQPVIKVKSVRPMEGYTLLLRFFDDEFRIFDFKPLLKYPCYAALSDKIVFDTVYVDYGSTVWNNGDIDIAPEYLFENSIPA